MTSKTIIISSQGASGRGILSLVDQDDILECRLRLYDVPKLSASCKLGIYHQGQVYSSNLLLKNGVYTSSLVGSFDMNQDFYSAIIDTSQNNKVVLSGGTYAGYFFNENVFDSNQTETLQEKIEQEEYTTQQEDTPKEDCFDDCDKCAKCKYKEFFYAENLPKEDMPKQESIIQEKQEEKTSTLLDSIIPQFDYIFSHYDVDEVLTNLIPNSKFVKVSEGHDFYSIGVIYENEQIKYLCYAVFATNNAAPPMEIGKNYQWLPLDKEDPLSEGYYIVFQDAVDLKIVEL